MALSSNHQSFGFPQRASQSLRNDRCHNILFKAVFEHFIEIKNIAALLLTSKSFQNSSFGANLVVNFVIDDKTIPLLESVLSPSSCFSLQFAPSLYINQSRSDSEKVNRSITSFVGELVSTRYLRLSLRSLSLHSVTKEVLSYFFGSSIMVWPQLRDLTLKECDVNDLDLEIIARNAVQLRAVDLSESPKITDAGIAHISKLSGITSLNLYNCASITDAGIEHLSKLFGITSLNLTCCNLITDLGLEHVSKLSDIRSLDLACCRMITDAGLECISKLDGITSLGLGGCNRITAAGLEHISKLSGITSLDLWGCLNIADVGFAHVAKLIDITTLNLSFGNFTDAGLEHVAKLSKLTSLRLWGCHNITDAGLERISKLSNITSLDLSECGKITGAGLQHLWKLAGCTSLNLANCDKITVAATKQLRSALPNCAIKEY